MSNSSERPAQVAVVLSGWPRVSEVFALNEVIALRRAGMLAAVFALKAGETGVLHPAAQEIAPLVQLVEPGDTWSQASAIARALDGIRVDGVHGYFAHQPAAVAAEAAGLLGVPYGFSVHALDARKVPRDELAGRASKAAVVIACNRDAAAEVAAAGTTPLLIRHGVDLGRFRPSAPPAGEPVSLLAVGRLVEKKGFSFLIDALSRLDRPFELRLVGAGPLQTELAASVDSAGLRGQVRLLGRVTHETLPGLYRGADVVIVPSVIDSRGDRDGLPNVVLEAMASQRAVIASDVAAISTAVRHDVTGVLVRPGDAAVLAEAIGRLIDDPAERVRLGRAARAEVEAEFELGHCSAVFCRALEHAYA